MLFADFNLNFLLKESQVSHAENESANDAKILRMILFKEWISIFRIFSCIKNGLLA